MVSQCHSKIVQLVDFDLEVESQSDLILKVGLDAQ